MPKSSKTGARRPPTFAFYAACWLGAMTIPACAQNSRTPAPRKNAKSPISKTPKTVAAPISKPASKRGATVPWLAYEAETATTNGTRLTRSRVVGEVAAECSGRGGVTLDATGQYLRWKTLAPANALVVRLSIPDAPSGGGLDSTLNLYVNGKFRQSIPVSSRHSWLYGSEDVPVNAPGGTARRMFDESSAIIGQVPTGATVELRKDAANSAKYYTVDFVELEQAPPASSMPPNFVSITDFGATPNDDSDDMEALAKAYAAANAAGKGLWIPSGTFRQSQRLTVENIAVKGAGMWHSKLLSHTTTANHSNDTAGFWVLNNCQFSDFAIFGQMTERGPNRNVSPFRGPFGTGSIIENVWGEHSECFVWAGVDSSPVLADGLIVRQNRVRNNYADGITLASGTVHSLIENNHVRNTGDDGFAIFSSPRTKDALTSSFNTIRNCSAQLPWRASGIGVYGGEGNTVENCAVYDTLTYPGVTVQRGHDSRPFGPGATTLRNLELVRCGGTFWRGQQYGAIWVSTTTDEIRGGNILLQNIDITDASYSGIHVQSNKEFHQSGVTFDQIRVRGAGTYGVYIRGGAVGAGTFRGVSVSGATLGGVKMDAPATYTLTREAGNTGW